MTDTTGSRKPKSFNEQIFRECEAMAKYAFASGLNVPSTLAARLDHLNLRARPKTTASERTPTAATNPAKPRVGVLQPPPRLVPNFKAIALIHLELARVVAPAKPRGILLLEQESTSSWNFLGPVPLVRQMMVLAIISLIAFVLVSLSSSVSETEIVRGLLSHSGLPLLLNILFLLAASALGASFAGLFQANKYCVEGAYDPKYDSSYWVRFVLGLISGLILAELIFSYTSPDAALGNGDLSKGAQALVKPILAMLGGFSSDLVFRILSRLVASVESLVRGNPREQVNTQKQTVQDQAAIQVDQERVKLAAGLMSLTQKLASGIDSETLSGELASLVDRLTGVRDEIVPSGESNLENEASVSKS